MLRPGVRKREVLGWAFYDFANSGYTTVVITAVFNAYFVGVITDGAPWGTLAWTATLAVSSLLVAVLAPVIGAWADARTARLRVLLASTIGCVVTTAALSVTGPDTLLLTVILVIVSSVCFGLGESTIASFLPDLAEPSAIGKISGWGWGLGYFGGMLTLGLSIAWLMSSPGRGMTAAQSVPQTMLITAIIFGLSSIPTFALLRERGARGALVSRHVAGERTGSTFRASLAALRHLPDLHRLLWCTVLYQSGISVVISLAAVYASQQMGFNQVDTMLLVFAVNIASAAGALAFGPFQDRSGHVRALAVTLIGWVLMTLLAGLGESRTTFWVAAALAGLCMGASQSGGRAMVGLLAPPERLAEFFGLWSLAVRVAAIVGPLAYGLITWASDGQHRLAIMSTGVFFLGGLWVLRGLDIERGRKAALQF